MSELSTVLPDSINISASMTWFSLQVKPVNSTYSPIVASGTQATWMQWCNVGLWSLMTIWMLLRPCGGWNWEDGSGYYGVFLLCFVHIYFLWHWNIVAFIKLLSMWKHRFPKWGVTLKLQNLFVGFDSICCPRSLCWFVTRPWLQQKFSGGFFLNCREDAKIYFECLLRCWKFVLSKSCRSFSIKYGIHVFSI